MMLRDYQVEAINALLIPLHARKAVLLQSPTGMGKTVIATEVIRLWLKSGERCLFLAHRRELIHQCARKLAEFGIDAGIIMAGIYPSPEWPIQVASVDTLRTRTKRSGSALPQASLIIIDEAHRSASKTYQWIIDEYRQQGAAILGITATPIRADGVGLGRFYDTMIRTKGVQWAVQHGVLVPVRYYVPFVPDLSGVKIKAGDYDEHEIQAIMDQRTLVGDIVSNWVRLAQGRQTLVFASGVKNSIHIASEFERLGFKFAHVDGSTPSEERDATVSALRDRKIDGICNAQVFTEGTDIPVVSCIVLAQPTRSLGKYLQMAGRALRPAKGKTDCIILDHAGAFLQHGRVDRPIEWELTLGRELVEKQAEMRKREPVSFTCHECKFVFSGHLTCPQCGTRIRLNGKARDYLEGDLVAMTNDEFRDIEQRPSPKDKQRFYFEMMTHAAHRKIKPGWCAYVFAEKFGAMPPWSWRDEFDRMDSATKESYSPSAATIAYIRSRAIRRSYRERKKTVPTPIPGTV
jgi:superfamily II DNA or RNA helicase